MPQYDDKQPGEVSQHWVLGKVRYLDFDRAEYTPGPWCPKCNDWVDPDDDVHAGLGSWHDRPSVRNVIRARGDGVPGGTAEAL